MNTSTEYNITTTLYEMSYHFHNLTTTLYELLFRDSNLPNILIKFLISTPKSTQNKATASYLKQGFVLHRKYTEIYTNVYINL